MFALKTMLTIAIVVDAVETVDLVGMCGEAARDHHQGLSRRFIGDVFKRGVKKVELGGHEG